MKRLIYGILTGVFLITLTSCASERPYEYPTVFDKKNEPAISKTIRYTDPTINTDKTEKTFLNMVEPYNESDEFIHKPSEPVDIFSLGDEVTPPSGCTTGVDC